MKTKHTKFIYFIALTIVLSLGLFGCGSGAPKVDWELSVTGDVTTPLALSFDELAKMEQGDLSEIRARLLSQRKA